MASAPRIRGTGIDRANILEGGRRSGSLVHSSPSADMGIEELKAHVAQAIDGMEEEKDLKGFFQTLGLEKLDKLSGRDLKPLAERLEWRVHSFAKTVLMPLVKAWLNAPVDLRSTPLSLSPVVEKEKETTSTEDLRRMMEYVLEKVDKLENAQRLPKKSTVSEEVAQLRLAATSAMDQMSFHQDDLGSSGPQRVQGNGECLRPLRQQLPKLVRSFPESSPNRAVIDLVDEHDEYDRAYHRVPHPSVRVYKHNLIPSGPDMTARPFLEEVYADGGTLFAKARLLQLKQRNAREVCTLAKVLDLIVADKVVDAVEVIVRRWSAVLHADEWNSWRVAEHLESKMTRDSVALGNPLHLRSALAAAKFYDGMTTFEQRGRDTEAVLNQEEELASPRALHPLQRGVKPHGRR